MRGAVAALARVSVALLHEHPALSVGEHGTERMITRGARPTRDVEGAAQQRLVVRARGWGGHRARVST